MSERIPQSTAIRVPLQAYLSADHITPATGKTIAVTVSKNGAAYGNPSGGPTNATPIGNGSYYVDLTTTDTATLGPVFVLGSEGTIDNIIAIYNVVKATNAGFTGIPDAVANANGGLPILSVSGTTLGYTVTTVTTTATATTAVNLTNLPALPSNWITAASITASALNGKGDWLLAANYTTPPTASTIATVTRDINNTAPASNSLGAAVNSAASAGDPWSVAIPGSYGAGTAGFIVGTNINATVSSRSTYAGGAVASVTAPVTVGTNSDKTGYVLAAAGLDTIAVESGVNVRQALSPILAAAGGVLSGAGTGTIVIKGGGVATTRILATTDSFGNRPVVTLFPPA